MIVFLPILIILVILLIIFLIKKKCLVKFIIIALILSGLFTVFIKRHDIKFYFDSKKFEYINEYDYSKDIENLGHISETGAAKIAKEHSKSEKISKLNVTLENNNTSNFDLTNLDFSLNNFNDLTIIPYDACWKVSFVSGWDKLCNHEKIWYYKINYYTGEIVSSNTTK